MKKNNYLKNIAEIISKNIKPKKLVLFGSMASGSPTPNSDIDLCVIQDKTGDKSDEYIKIRKLLSNVLMPMDILIFSNEEYEKRKDIWGTVQYEINKNGVVLYERRN